MTTVKENPERIYQGQFGEYQITEADRRGVIVYRSGLVLAAISFAIASNLVLGQANNPDLLAWTTPLFFLFSLGLGISLLTIHIYLTALHRLLQIFWLVGTTAAIILTVQQSTPLCLYVYQHPASLLGVGFIFAALTGIYFKEAFCFNRLETKILTPLVPLLLLGHLFGFLPLEVEQILLAAWTILFIIFAARKCVQPLDPDIGDKSVFAYLKKQKNQQVTA